jgi:hypothetical protein
MAETTRDAEFRGLSEHLVMAATYQVSQPEPFNFTTPEWLKSLWRFERFRQASGLTEKSDEVQVNTLVYYIGDQADDILRSFKHSEADAKVYATVKAKFDGHFVKHWNISIQASEIQQSKPRARQTSGYVYHCTLHTCRELKLWGPNGGIHSR